MPALGRDLTSARCYAFSSASSFFLDLERLRFLFSYLVIFVMLFSLLLFLVALERVLCELKWLFSADFLKNFSLNCVDYIDILLLWGFGSSRIRKKGRLVLFFFAKWLVSVGTWWILVNFLWWLSLNAWLSLAQSSVFRVLILLSRS